MFTKDGSTVVCKHISNTHQTHIKHTILIHNVWFIFIYDVYPHFSPATVVIQGCFCYRMLTDKVLFVAF